MKKIIGLCLLATIFLTSSVYAQEVYKTETIIGIGATLQKLTDGTVKVDAIIPNTPADRAGLSVDDIILEVKSMPSSTVVDVRQLPLPDIIALIRGPIGVPVEITFTRGDLAPVVLSIVREKFEIEDEK